MAIYGPSWASGDQITRTKQANMVSDGINIIDDIQPQYNFKVYTDRLHEIVAANATPVYFYIEYKDNVRSGVPGVGTVEELKWVTDIAVLMKNIACIRVKLLPSMTFTQITFAYKICTITGSAGTRQARRWVSKNGTNLDYTTSIPVAVYPAFNTISANISLASPSAGDIIDAGLSLYAVGNNPSAIICAKDIEIYLS